MAHHPSDELTENLLLSQLPHRELELIRESSKVVQLERRDGIYEPDSTIGEVYFPLDSIVSLIALTDQGRATVEVATIGREGMVGLPVFLGATTSPNSAFCQIPGGAVKMTARSLREVLQVNGSLHILLNRLTQATMVQIAQNVVCNNAHSVERRACRWLCMTHDRVGRDEFLLTQEFLAQMLGVRRPTVSQLAAQLQQRGLIRYRRGCVTIADRDGLEDCACECYRIVRTEFDKLASTPD